MVSNELIFLGLIFIAVIFLSQALFLPVYNPQRAKTALVRQRLKKLSIAEGDNGQQISLLRKSRLDKLGAVGQSLEKVKLIENLSYRLELADYQLMGHKYLLLALISALVGVIIGW